MCDATLGNSGPLVCTRTDEHSTGHVFVSSATSDSHDVSEAASEATR